MRHGMFWTKLILVLFQRFVHWFLKASRNVLDEVCETVRTFCRPYPSVDNTTKAESQHFPTKPRTSHRKSQLSSSVIPNWSWPKFRRCIATLIDVIDFRSVVRPGTFEAK